MHLIGECGPELIAPVFWRKSGAAWPGRGLGAKRPSKPLAWRRRAEAKLQASEALRMEELSQRAARLAAQAALSTQIAARSARLTSGC